MPYELVVLKNHIPSHHQVTVAWKEELGIQMRELLNTLHQVFGISFKKICPPDPSKKDDISGEEGFSLRPIEGKGTRRMAWALVDLEDLAPQSEVPFLEIKVNSDFG